jgi:hypothetical protein
MRKWVWISVPQTKGPHPFKVAVSACGSVAVANSEL